MNTFNIIAGVASIISFGVSLWAIKRVRDVEVRINITDQSQLHINQKAQGEDIKQAGRDMNA